MFLRILKKDLKRKKTMNVILLIFVIFAAMFVASGLNNVITVAKGTDYYLNRADIGDYVVLTMGADSTGHISEVLGKEPEVTRCRIEPVIFGSKDNITKENGTKAKTKNAAIFQSISQSKIHFFDKNNQLITQVKKGWVYVSGAFLKKNKLKTGDTILVNHSGTNLKLQVQGKAKDALLGSDFMGNTRLILNDSDMDTLLENPKIEKNYLGEIAYLDTTDKDALIAAVSEIPCVGLSYGRDTFKLCYVMDMIVAFMILIMSICLILVSFAVLRFSINFSISEEYREIGVMKAIGISNRKIRELFMIKYLMIALMGAGIGFFASIPFGNMLISSVSDNMVLGNSYGNAMNFAGAIGVVSVVCLFAYGCTGKVKNASPIDAIRSGQTGERYRQKTLYRIENSHMGTSLYMGLNDVLSSPRRFLTMILSFFICTLFVLMTVNTTNTMKSNKLIAFFGGTKSDLYVTNVDSSMELMASDSKKDIEDYLKEKEMKLAKAGMPANIGVEVQYKYKVSFNGKNYSLTCQQGVGFDANEYHYTKGSPPQSKNEIAITPKISKLTGAKIGDTIKIDFGNEVSDCMVTAYYETFNQVGELIRLYHAAPTEMLYCSSLLQYQVDFEDNPSQEKIQQRKNMVKKIFDTEDVKNEKEYCIESIGVVDTMEAVQFMLLGITLIVVFLVSILMERAFISDEKSQIAILKALGFQDWWIMVWHIWRFVIVAVIAVGAAAIASIPMTKLCITPIFEMMGTGEINYHILPLQIFVIYPAMILLMTLGSVWLASLNTKTITCSDTAYME